MDQQLFCDYKGKEKAIELKIKLNLQRLFSNKCRLPIENNYLSIVPLSSSYSNRECIHNTYLFLIAYTVKIVHSFMYNDIEIPYSTIKDYLGITFLALDPNSPWNDQILKRQHNFVFEIPWNYKFLT